MIRIVYYAVARHMEGGEGLQHIAALRCEPDGDGVVIERARGVIVGAINRGDMQLRVRDGDGAVVVYVDHLEPPLLRTVPDGASRECLLSLPEY